MKTKIQKLFMSVMAIGALTLFFGAKNHETNPGPPKVPDNCVTVSPGSLCWGVRGCGDGTQTLTVTCNGTWGAYVSASWIKINGGGTISSGGNATVNVTISGTYPPR